MTTLLDPPAEGIVVEPRERLAPEASPSPAPQAEPAAATEVQPPTQRIRAILAIWLVALVAGMAFVVYGFGPFFQERAQRSLMRSVRADISRAANEATGLQGVTVASKAPQQGTPVGVLEIGATKLQQVVVEGATSTATRKGPGHVPGTAGLGQPGNSVVVARRSAFGGPFSGIRKLRAGDDVLVTTTQGQSVYEVRSVKHATLRAAKEGDPDPSVIERVYGPSDDDRLTLVTSAGATPWNKTSAWVVTAKLKGTAFAPTPQGGRSDNELGRSGESGASASVLLALLAYGLVLGGTVLLYRRLQPRTAYLLTIAPVLALTIIAAETLSRALPAWM